MANRVFTKFQGIAIVSISILLSCNNNKVEWLEKIEIKVYSPTSMNDIYQKVCNKSTKSNCSCNTLNSFYGKQAFVIAITNNDNDDSFIFFKGDSDDKPVMIDCIDHLFIPSSSKVYHTTIIDGSSAEEIKKLGYNETQIAFCRIYNYSSVQNWDSTVLIVEPNIRSVYWDSLNKSKPKMIDLLEDELNFPFVAIKYDSAVGQIVDVTEDTYKTLLLD